MIGGVDLLHLALPEVARRLKILTSIDSVVSDAPIDSIDSIDSIVADASIVSDASIDSIDSIVSDDSIGSDILSFLTEPVVLLPAPKGLNLVPHFDPLLAVLFLDPLHKFRMFLRVHQIRKLVLRQVNNLPA